MKSKIVNLLPPPKAQAMGYTDLIFEDDFTSFDCAFGENKGEQWNAGLWWDKVPPKSAFHQEGTVLTITAPNDGHVDLCTQFHDIPMGATSAGGKQFLNGYFEARMCCFDWAAFWLFCWDRPWVYEDKVLADDPMTWTNEIDIIEGDGGYPDRAYCTLHANTSGNTRPDEQNDPNWFDCNTFLSGNWHNYGVMWHPDYLTWFVDEVPILTLDPYPSTNQPCQLILTAAQGGVGGSPSKTEPPQLKVDWVRVWR